MGDTVSLRVATPAGPTEIVGVVVERTAEVLVVRRRDGRTEAVPAASVTAGRVVPPGVARRITPAALEAIAADGWRALEVEALGGWTLRAAGGFTARANSALALGDPDRPLGDALTAVERWYGERSLPPRVQLVEGGSPAGLADLLRERDWRAGEPDEVMTAEIAHVLRAAPPSSAAAAVRVDLAPDAGWLASYRTDSRPLPAAAPEVLANHPAVGFVSVRAAELCLAIARVAVDGRWAGLFGVEVDPAHRGRGLGAAVSLAGLQWAAANGGRHCYVQVASGNEAGRGLYGRLGFIPHHDYAHWMR